ncbi:DUF732 domain-containing protein [Nocardia bovistercoris]|uniref:DUF732 domain-containing protein n=1 Tax=Nocardia bovistercoris TaxID=2785916 RepID=A0A931N1I7_9NOCA|nr:DUF732 domain-containing protein [Nocardia bovistercoris]MBH0775747.1 hypothetical protein [Nocardia bovistercoris]
MRTILATAITAGVLIACGIQSAHAAPHSGPAGNTAGSANSGSARNPADLQFLEQIDFGAADYATQDAVLDLARAECAFLDTHGNTPANRTRLAESTRKAVRYPYLFLDAAVKTICPWHRL